MDPLEAVLTRLDKLVKSGDSWSARCPAHDDNSPTLSVSEGDDGRVLIHCQAGCQLDSVVEALGLTVKDLFPPKRRSNKAEIVATYNYTDPHGHGLFQVVRYDPKGFRQRRPGPDGEWIWNLKGVRRVLYRLPEVIAAVKAGRTIYVAEGEKDVDALVASPGWTPHATRPAPANGTTTTPERSSVPGR